LDLGHGIWDLRIKEFFNEEWDLRFAHHCYADDVQVYLSVSVDAALSATPRLSHVLPVLQRGSAMHELATSEPSKLNLAT